MATKRVAKATWENDLLHGHGKVVGTSGGLAEASVSWSSRTEASAGRTSPEELLAAAQAACLSMALSNGLAKMGKAPERIEVTATCTFDRVGDQWTVTTMDLDIGAKAAGLDAASLASAADAASKGCPIARAIQGNVAVRVAATRLL
ncbi:MAG TPA: OsmC family peroxiredoxin [Thermoplasmata archaeon]|nr:OsmC family peroxiredoxin [Thermoplasmata archaeon]